MPLNQVEGQARAVETLLRALGSGRLHHAYLFDGPHGIGKGMTAQAFAEALLCEQPQPNLDACGRCSACRRAQDRQHPDLHIVARRAKGTGGLESSIRIDQVRALQRSLSFKSFEGARRVVLLFEPERMNPSTANALLKTLEEPGDDTHFILISDGAHQLLPTIVSRCQLLRFAPLARALVAHHLEAGAGLSPEAASLLAGLSEGSIGRGLELAESPWLEQREALITQVDDPDGLRKVPKLLELADLLARRKDELPMVFHILRTWFRDLLMIQVGVPVERWIHRDLAERAQARAAQLDQAQIMRRIDWLNETEHNLFVRNANARLHLETLLLRMVGGARAQGAA